MVGVRLHVANLDGIHCLPSSWLSVRCRAFGAKSPKQWKKEAVAMTASTELMSKVVGIQVTSEAARRLSQVKVEEDVAHEWAAHWLR